LMRSWQESINSVGNIWFGSNWLTGGGLVPLDRGLRHLALRGAAAAAGTAFLFWKEDLVQIKDRAE
jgi:hypothetical protein